MVRVKVCGMTNLEDALVAVMAGADALGFNFWRQSARYLKPEQAAEIIAHLPPFVAAVGLFVNEESHRLRSIAQYTGIRTVQLHGDESPAEAAALAADGLAVVRAFRVGRSFQPQRLRDYPDATAFLLDTEVKGQRGGTGKTFDWNRARQANRYGRILLAGGLSPENVEEAIRQAQPYGVDVCSGVEKKPGWKDHARLRTFIQRAKAASCD